MKKLLAALLIAVLPLAVQARVVAVATAPSGETLSLTDEKWECPSGETEGFKWDARKVIYHDPRDGEKQAGCYIIDTRQKPLEVVILFKQGSLAGAPVVLPVRLFKPEI